MPRDYAKFSHRFWIGDTGRKIRSNRSAQVLAAYLITSPGSTMTGIYYLPLPVIAHETGMADGEVATAMAFLSSVDFAHYDPRAELVWVPSMAAWQIDEELKPGDKRVIGVRRELDALRWHSFVFAFWERYGEAFCLGEVPVKRPSDPPSKALRSHEQEQEQSVSVSLGSALEAPDPEARAIPDAPYVAPRPRLRVDNFAAATSGEFQRVFDAYPRKDDRISAQAEFQAHAAVFPGGEKGLADAILAAFPAMLKRAPYNGPNDKRPFLEKVLRLRRWQDPPSAPDDSKATGPPKPSPGATYKQPRCNLHEENPRARASNVDWCPNCREHKARNGTREGAPKTAAEILAGDRPP